MGLYRENHVILISRLVKLWVAEGFLKRVSEKRPEDVARAYLKDLIDRNLVMTHKVGSIGGIKECKVHDLLRDLCLREAQKQGFYIVFPNHEIEDRFSRIVMPSTTQDTEEEDALSSDEPQARSMILDLDGVDVPPYMYSMMRTVQRPRSESENFLDNMHQLVNLRVFNFIQGTEFPNLTGLLWNLQTLHVDQLLERLNAPSDIWYMSHIRHLHIPCLDLPDPPLDVQADDIILANLQSLRWIRDFTCTEQVVKTIPNLRKLEIVYYNGVDDDRFCLTNLVCLDKLESLNCRFEVLKCQINYPRSLKKLRLDASRSQCWEAILDKIGALPLLQKLKLNYGTFNGKWETSESQFPSLKYLYLGFCEKLQVWTSDASHFPRLEQLHLYCLFDIGEIPLDFAEISTLGLIEVESCSDSAVESAKRIVKEQEALHGEEETSLQIQVQLRRGNNPKLKSLRSPNFHVTV